MQGFETSGVTDMSEDEVRGRVRNDRGHGNRLRDEIVESAIRLIDADTDGRQLTLRGIAREAGISAPSIYGHFADLQAITDAVLSQSFTELDAAVSAALAEQTTPEDAIVAGCMAYVEFGWRHLPRYRFMIAAGGFAPDAIRTFSRIEQALTQCVERGTSTSVNPHQDVFLLWVAMHGIATLQKPARPELRQLGPIDRAQAARTLVTRLARLDPGPDRTP